MQRTSKIHEKFLGEIWKKQNFSNNLFTKDGQKVEIIDAGMENNELGGPDFKNARIKIGNLTYFGDVEIDSFHSDWKSHGHNINRKYNKVICTLYSIPIPSSPSSSLRKVVEYPIHLS